MEHAKQEAAKVKAHVYEQTERTIADVTARAERVRSLTSRRDQPLEYQFFTFE